MFNWTQGWKTYAAAAVAAFVAANSVLKWVPPDIQAAILSVAAALGFWGLRDIAGRIEQKLEDEIQRSTRR